jgi:hypothetical protein
MRRSTCAGALVFYAALHLSACTRSLGHDPGGGGRANAASGSGGSRAKRRPAVIDAGDGTQGPFKCRGIESVCSLLESFPTRTDVSWGDGDDFHAGVRLLGDGLARVPGENELHVTGNVTRAGVGFALWFDDCMNLSRFRGLRFVLRGRVVGASPRVEVALPTNGNFPWQAAPAERKGACASNHPENLFVDCVPATASVTLGTKPVLLAWSEVTGGKPNAWDPRSSPAELLSVEFRFPWDEKQKPYKVDVTLDDFGFISDVTAECAVFR